MASSHPGIRNYLAILHTITPSHLLPPSQTPINAGQPFSPRHLQSKGLLNINNTCCHLSLILCFHRINLKICFDHQTAQNDVVSLCLLEILKALPSNNAFSVMPFVDVWNSVRPGQRIGQNEAIQTLSDLILDHLPLQSNGPRPVLTQFTASYQCHHCCHQVQDLQYWDNKPFSRIPIVNVVEGHAPLPAPGDPPIQIGNLLTSMLQTPFQIRCSSCNRFTEGRYRVKLGDFTFVNINRFHHRLPHNQIIRIRLSETRTAGVGETYLGTLVSCISHMGFGTDQGHYVSYHQVGGTWFLNDDSRNIQQVGYHPFRSPVQGETVNFLVYKNS